MTPAELQELEELRALARAEAEPVVDITPEEVQELDDLRKLRELETVKVSPVTQPVDMAPEDLQELEELRALEAAESAAMPEDLPTIPGIPSPRAQIPRLPPGLDIPGLQIPQYYREEIAGARETLAQPGLFSKVLGALQYGYSPIRALSRDLAEDPVRGLTGSEQAARIAGLAAEIGIPLSRVLPSAPRAIAPVTPVTPVTPAPTLKPIPQPVTKAPEEITRTKPLPINAEILAIPGEIGIAYHKAINPEIFQKAGTAAVDFFSKNPAAYDRTLSMTENIGRNIGKGRGISPDFLKGYGLADDEVGFVDSAYETMRQAAQTMGIAGRVKKSVNETLAALSPEAREALKIAGIETDNVSALLPWWRRADSITVGMMVTQLSTAAGNAVTSAERMALDIPTKAIEAGLSKMAGKTPTISALDGLDTFFATLKAVSPSGRKENKEFIEQLGKAFPGQTERLLSHYNSGIEALGVAGKETGVVGKVLRKGEELVHMANIFNRAQEFTIRGAVFQSKIAQDVKRTTGRELSDIMKSGEVYKIPEKVVEGALKKALDVTFGAIPKQGTPSRMFTDLVFKLGPVARLGVPFPRFLTQALKYAGEHSPLGWTRFMSKAERAKVAAGDMEGISRSIIGIGMFGASVAIRESENAGPEWYQYKTDEGKIIDLQKYWPINANLFAAEMMRRAMGKAKGPPTTGAEILKALGAPNMRNGTGLALVDDMVNSALDPEDKGELPKFGKKLVGEYVGRLTTPLAQIRDLYDEVSTGVSLTRERSPEGLELIGPTMFNIPGVSRMLPEKPSPTTDEPRVTAEHPFFLKQLFSIRVTPAENPGAAELSRLRFFGREVLQKTGIKSIDDKRIKAMGPLVKNNLSAFVKSKEYTSLRNDDLKEKALYQRMRKLKTEMWKQVKPTLSEKELHEYKQTRVPRRLRD